MTTKARKKFVNYELLVAGIKNCPVTYLPALLKVCLEQVVKRRVFVDGGLERFIDRVLNNDTD